MAKIIKNYEELVKEGYGQGHGRDYKPCKTVQNFSSIGRSHRVQGRVSKRLHHLFSDLELSTFYCLIGIITLQIFANIILWISMILTPSVLVSE